MKYIEFRRHLGKAGVSVNEFASLIDVKPNSISNYAKKGVVPTTYAALVILLGNAGDNGIDFRALFDKFGLQIRDDQNFGGGTVADLDAYRKVPRKQKKP